MLGSNRITVKETAPKYLETGYIELFTLPGGQYSPEQILEIYPNLENDSVETIINKVTDPETSYSVYIS